MAEGSFMSLAFDTPWWALSITGSIAAAVLGLPAALFVTRRAFLYNRHLKLLDATRIVCEKRLALQEGIALGFFSHWNASDAIESIGGQRAIVTRLVELKAAVEMLEIYGDKRITDAGLKLYASAHELGRRSDTDVTSDDVRAMDDMATKERDARLDAAMKSLTDATQSSEIDKNWSELLRLVRKNLHWKKMISIPLARIRPRK